MAKFRKKAEEFVAFEWKGEGTSVPGIEAVFDRKEGSPNDGTNRYFVVISGNRRYLLPNDWVLYNTDNLPYQVLSSNEIHAIADEIE